MGRRPADELVRAASSRYSAAHRHTTSVTTIGRRLSQSMESSEDE